MDRKPFQTLARIVQTLAAGRPVSLPFAMGQRNMEWAETFEVGRWRVDNEDAVMHRMTTRKGGVTKDQSAEPTDWSLADILKWIGEMDDESFAYMERALLPLDLAGPTVEGIADLSDGPGVAMVAGQTWRRTGEAETMETDTDPKWSFDAAVMAVRQGR